MGYEPSDIDVRRLRRFAAGMSERGQAPTTVARKLAALRGLFRSQVEIGARQENPADLLSSPKKPQRLPRVLRPDEVAALLDRIPANDAARAPGPRPVRARVRIGAARRGARDPECRVGAVRRRSGADRGQGRQDADRAGRRVRAAARSSATCLAGVRRSTPSAKPPYSSQSRVVVCRHPTSAAGCALGASGCGARAGARRASIRTRSGTRSRPICSRVAPTSGRFKSCLATQPSQRLRSTLG